MRWVLQSQQWQVDGGRCQDHGLLSQSLQKMLWLSFQSQVRCHCMQNSVSATKLATSSTFQGCSSKKYHVGALQSKHIFRKLKVTLINNISWYLFSDLQHCRCSPFPELWPPLLSKAGFPSGRLQSLRTGFPSGLPVLTGGEEVRKQLGAQVRDSCTERNPFHGQSCAEQPALDDRNNPGNRQVPFWQLKSTQVDPALVDPFRMES